MLDQDVVRIAEERLLLEISDQTNNLNQEINRSQRAAAAKGSSLSGPAFRGITDLCILFIKNRTQLVWQTFFRFLTIAGISYSETLGEELKSLVAKYLPENLFKDILQQKATSVGQPDSFTRLGPELDAARIAALAKVGTEIDLFVLSLKQKVELKEKETSSMIFNIYSPIGAIQTGDSSIANVSQTIDTEIREQLSKALEEISSRLAQEDIALPYPKGEVIEIIKEGQEELKKQFPNVTRLRGILSSVGTAIQTIASMKTAYEALKSALTFLGISLP
jgi:hypothetical protein